MNEDLHSSNRTEVQPPAGVSIMTTAPASVTVMVSGEVDTFGTRVLDAALDVAWADDPRDLVVDLTNVTFLGVSGLNTLLRARRTAQQRAAHLSVWPHSRQMERLLELAGASDVTCTHERSAGDGDLEAAPERGASAEVDRPGRPWWDTSISDDPLLRTVRVGAAWCSADSLQAGLESVCSTALATIPGTEGAGIVLAGDAHHGGESRAATDGRAMALEPVREGLRQPAGRDENPDPAWIDGAVVVDDLGHDHRWPELAARAEELEVRSVLCLGIGAIRPQGALTVYSSRPRAFRGEALLLGRALASVAAIVLSAAQRHQHLTSALTTRTVIGQAKGILMERHKISADQAFLLLSRASSLRNVKVAVLAARVAETGEL